MAPGLATNILLGMAYISRHTEKISSKTRTVVLVNSNSALIADATEEGLSIVVKKNEPQGSSTDMNVQAHTLTIDVSGIHTILSVDTATLATTAIKARVATSSPAHGAR